MKYEHKEDDQRIKIETEHFLDLSSKDKHTK